MSQTTGHTTGPWYCSSGAVWADKGERRGVAMRVSLSPIPPVERDANMRLIAQAPAMLAGYRAIVHLAETLNNRQHAGLPITPVMWSELYARCNEARAILRATEGAQTQ